MFTISVGYIFITFTRLKYNIIEPTTETPLFMFYLFVDADRRSNVQT